MEKRNVFDTDGFLQRVCIRTYLANKTHLLFCFQIVVFIFCVVPRKLDSSLVLWLLNELQYFPHRMIIMYPDHNGSFL